MALQKKADHLVQLRADIMVVQECSEKSVSALANSTKHQTAWFGTNKNKGIAVITAPPANPESGTPGTNLGGSYSTRRFREH